MGPARLSAAVEAAAIMRRAEANGDFAAILRKGDAERGSLLLVVRSRGAFVACLDRTLSLDGRYRWATAGPGESATEEQLADFVAKRVSFDSDSWLIELDIAQPERFIAETIASG